MKVVDVVAAGSILVGSGILLQGCDSESGINDTTVTTTIITTDSEPGPGPSPGPSTAITTAAPPAGAPPRSEKFTQPLASSEAALALSEAFHSFDPNSTSSSLGVTITWLKETDDKMNLYCGAVAGNDENGCFDASASCRMSTIQHNHLLPLIEGKLLTFSSRKVGVVFNQVLVEQYFGKCSYLFDGGTVNRYNYGCGSIGAEEVLNCDSEHSPYSNICPSSNKVCTADDPEVNSVEHTSVQDPMGFYKGPAYNVRTEELTHWNGQQMWETKDELRTMINDRFEVQQAQDAAVHNELILDERLILTQLWWDPATVVTALAYFRGDAEARSQAVRIQQSFKNQWGVEPPLVGVDADCQVATPGCAPFYADSGDEIVV